jgi:osmotically-inducible protein OsmY
MRVAHRLAIVSSAIILAAGCSSNQERRASYNDNFASPAYAGSTSSESSPSSSIAAATASQGSPSEADRTLTAQVQGLLTNENTVAVISPNLLIRTQKGTVILSGSVKSEAEKQRIEGTIRNISGVVSVNNQLEVTQKAPENVVLSPTSARPNDTSRVYAKDPSDPDASSAAAPTADSLSVDIQASTDADRTLGQQIMKDVCTDKALAAFVSMIKIQVDSGQVTVRGTVKNEQEKQSVEAAVQKVSGVTKVDNQLQVETSQ